MDHLVTSINSSTVGVIAVIFMGGLVLIVAFICEAAENIAAIRRKK